MARVNDAKNHMLFQVVVLEVRNLKSCPDDRIIYCTMEVDNSNKLVTDQVEASRGMWDTQGDFSTSHPLPTVKVTEHCPNGSKLHSYKCLLFVCFAPFRKI